MASTYTPNLGIEKPGTGDQSGTWGDTVNDNSDILDRAINGVGAISLSGTTHTLTTSDGTLSDGQYKVLVLGGTPSGTNTITVAPNDAQKLYFVKNSSGQSAVFTQGSGGNVTVANGDTKIIYCDGAGSGAAVVDLTADFAMSSPSITGGSINNVAVGDTTASSGAFTTLSASGAFSLAGTAVTATAAELNILDGVTATTAEINILDGVTATTAELNILDGVTATTAELNFVDGVTSAIQTQLDAKAPIDNPTFTTNVSVSGTNAGFLAAVGAAGTPTHSFATDTDTGMFLPATNSLGFSTAGSERFRINSSGAVGLSGANYGSVGQTIITDGSGDPVYWGYPSKLSTASGSAPSYSARAWVNFNGTGTVAIRASGNVSSITDNGTGDYTVNFTTAMADANYSVSGISASASTALNNLSGYRIGLRGGGNDAPALKTTTQCRLQSGNVSNGVATDIYEAMASFFR